MKFFQYVIALLRTGADQRAVKQAMRRHNDQLFEADATVTGVAHELGLVIARTGDDLAFHLSKKMLPDATDKISIGQKLHLRYKGKFAPKVLQVDIIHGANGPLP